MKKGDISINVVVIAAIAVIILVILTVLVLRGTGSIVDATACESLPGYGPNIGDRVICSTQPNCGSGYQPNTAFSCADENQVCCLRTTAEPS